jgi:FMN-dependent NADH-azoreductase
MSNVLVITSSVSGKNSVSSALVAHAIAELQASDPQAAIVMRDLARTPVPHLDADMVAAVRGEPTTDPQRAARALSDELVVELRRANVLVIGSPMYNFGIPSTLKSWFDYVLRPGVTFRYTEAGPEGLLKGKRAIVVLSRGGFYSNGPAQALDSQEPHLRTLLGFIGVTDVTFVRAERLAFAEETQAQAIGDAKAALTATIIKLRSAA